MSKSSLNDSSSTVAKLSNTTTDIDVFRKPDPPPPLAMSQREKRKILEEEKFVQDLGHIIERDFFPHIKRLRAKEKYLAAVAKNDVVALRELHAEYKIHRGPTPSPSMMNQHRDTPSSSFETPIQRPGSDTPQSNINEKDLHETHKDTSTLLDDDEFDKKSEISTASSSRRKVRDLRLDQYLSLTTSEDNVSFEHIMHETEKKERTKPHQAWLYEQQALTHSSSDDKQLHQLPVPSIQDQAKANNPDNNEFWPYTVKNAVMYYPEGAKLTAAEKIELAKHVRVIQHGNTRFETDPFTITTESSSRVATPARPNALLRPQIDIDGKEIKPLESPKVGGYGYMVTPSPMPGTHGDESPMMTWGQIEGTPFCLDAGNETPHPISSGPSFKILETPLRERLALELVEKNAAQHRQKKLEAMKTINRNFASSSTNKQNKDLLVSTMSPAAQQLLSSRLGIQRSQSTRSQRNSALTPSPVVRNSIDRTPKTPVNVGIIKHSPQTPRANSSGSLTDNLLNLKR